MSPSTPDPASDDPDRTTDPISVDLVETTLRSVDRMGNQVFIDTVGWNEGERSHEFEEDMDCIVSGRVTELTMDAKFPRLSEVDEEGRKTSRHSVGTGEQLTLPRAQYELAVEPPVIVVIRFDAAASIAVTESDEVVLSFDQPEPVSIGFRSWLRYPKQVITVPRSTEGLATALSQLPSALHTTDSRRAGDTQRRHPPVIRYGDTVDIPEDVRDRVPNTGLELAVPDRMDVLFQGAPLAYYLGARVVLSEGAPRLRSSDGTIDHRFSSTPRFQYEVADLLRRVFLLDNLIRNDQHSHVNPVEIDLLERLDLVPGECPGYTDTERLRTYLDVDFERISDRLPEWHFVSYVEPTFENAQALPYLLRYLSFVFDPATYPELPRTGGASSLVDDYRQTVPERLTSDSLHGSAIAWLSSDPRPDHRPFVARPDAFGSTTKYLDRDETAGLITVVCTDRSRTDAFDRVTNQYEVHTPDDISIETYTDVSRRELRDLLQRGADFLHFLGPVEDGFQCTDGVLDTAAVNQSNVRLFFADGVDSVATAVTCIEAGSVGSIALESDHELAHPVRELLVGLLTRGCTVEQAVRYTRTAGTANTDLVVIGDGFQQLIRTMSLYSIPTAITPLDTNRFRLTVYPYIPEAGFVWRPEPQDLRPQLCGAPFEFTVTGPEIETLIERENLVPIYDGTIHWNRRQDFFNPLI